MDDGGDVEADHAFDELSERANCLNFSQADPRVRFSFGRGGGGIGSDFARFLKAFRAHMRTLELWASLRAYWRARWIGVYWHALTEKHMAPGGKMAKRDRAAYEAD